MDVLALASQTTNLLITAGAALGGAIIGVAGTLAATLLQNSYARSKRQAEAAAARRERTAAVLGRVRTFLTDATPERIGLNVNAERTPQELGRSRSGSTLSVTSSRSSQEWTRTTV